MLRLPGHNCHLEHLVRDLIMAAAGWIDVRSSCLARPWILSAARVERLVVGFADLLGGEQIIEILQHRPGGQILVNGVVLLRDRMCANDDGEPVLGLDVLLEIGLTWARWIADHQSGSQMNGFDTVLDHLVWNILNVPAGTAIA